MDYKDPDVSLKTRYRALVEIGFMSALLLLITIGIAFPKFRAKRVKLTPPKIEINIEKRQG